MSVSLKPIKLQTAIILHLPNELVLQIATHLKGAQSSEDLRHLALSHRHFRHTAHAALVQSGVVPLHGVANYVELICKHPEWIHLIKRIEIKDGVSSDRDFSPSLKAQQAFLGLIRALWPLTQMQQWEVDLEEKMMMMKSSEIWLLVLLITLSAAKELVITSKRTILGAEFRSLLGPTPSTTTTSKLGEKLIEMIWGEMEALSITGDQHVVRFPPADPNLESPFRCRYFKHVKVMTILGSLLPRSFASRIVFRFPSELEVLRVYCNQETCPWSTLSGLRYEIRACGSYRRLRHIQLFINHAARSLAWDIVKSAKVVDMVHLRDVVSETLAGWKDLDVLLETFFIASTSHRQVVLDPGQYRQGCLQQHIRRVKKQAKELEQLGWLKLEVPGLM
jgi:hypothetical protein